MCSLYLNRARNTHMWLARHLISITSICYRETLIYYDVTVLILTEIHRRASRRIDSYFYRTPHPAVPLELAIEVHSLPMKNRGRRFFR